jgi:hypothetical protein
MPSNNNFRHPLPARVTQIKNQQNGRVGIRRLSVKAVLMLDLHCNTIRVGALFLTFWYVA